MRSNNFSITLMLVLLIGYSLSLDAQKPIINSSGKVYTDPSKLKVQEPTGLKVAFSAKITQARTGNASYGDGNILRRFDKVDFNEGNGFEPTSGIFTSPVSGYYCFIFNVNLSNYGCYNYPLHYAITITKNGSQEIETFYLNVEPGPDGFTSQGFTFFSQLNQHQTISLKPNAPLCPGGRNNIVNSLIFSGYKIY